MARRAAKKPQSKVEATAAEGREVFDDEDPEVEVVDPERPQLSPEDALVERALKYYGHPAEMLDRDQPATRAGGVRLVPAGVRLYLKGGAIRMFKPSMDHEQTITYTDTRPQPKT